MAANPGQSEAIGVEELRALEASVLKALCLTINTAGSELKYKILDSLSEGDFYFPLNRALFQTLSELHRRGEYVISANLDEELQKTGEPIPDNFTIDELFSGTLPGLSDLNAWVVRLKERSRSGLVPTVAPPKSEPSVPVDGKFEATQVRSIEEVKQKIAEEHRRKSSPAVASSPDVSSPDIEIPFDMSELEQSTPDASPPVKETPPPEKPAPSVRNSSPSVTAPRKVVKAVLSSEADDWSNYMDDLAASQGKTFDTGFGRLDAALGGIGPGLMLLVDEDRERLFSFMKQVTDQFASTGDLRCLYIASELRKPQLRLRTLARLARVSIHDLEKGRVKKDSAEWKRIDAEGRKAAAWLKRVFVFEVEDRLELALARELIKKLRDPAGETSCIVIIDSLEKVARDGSSARVVSQLKSLADSLDVLILAATTDPTLLASRDADLAAVFRESGGGGVELEVLQAGKESSTVVAFGFEPDYCRFTES